MIEDSWWCGKIVSKSTASEDFPDSPFLCYEIEWDTGEQERMSPWDMEPIDESREFYSLFCAKMLVYYQKMLIYYHFPTF